MRTPESIAYARIGARGSAPGPALAAVADSLRRALPSNCYPTCVADTDPQTPALDYDCSFIAQWTEAGEFHQRELP